MLTWKRDGKLSICFCQPTKQSKSKIDFDRSGQEYKMYTFFRCQARLKSLFHPNRLQARMRSFLKKQDQKIKNVRKSKIKIQYSKWKYNYKYLLTYTFNFSSSF